MNEQADLFGWVAPQPYPAKGETFDPARDGKRLGEQCQRVHDFVLNRGWVTLHQIAKATGDPEASISARLRDLRKFGFNVEHRHVRDGLWQYRVFRLAYPAQGAGAEAGRGTPTRIPHGGTLDRAQ